MAYSTDPDEPVIRPRRAALAPRAAIGLGAVLVLLGVVLILRIVLTASDGSGATVAEARADGSPGPAGTAAAADLAPADPASMGTGTNTAPPAQIVVHVAGAVASPGVVVLPTGARIADAIDAAGGVIPEADTDQLNLARILSDGEQVRVPVIGEDASTWADSTTPASPSPNPAGGAGGRGTGTGVNINTASAAELENLPGIGPALAQRIIDYRDQHGPFSSVDALTEVPGIGQAKLEALRAEATV